CEMARAFQSINRRSNRTARTSKRPAFRKFRTHLEHLEERVVPAPLSPNSVYVYRVAQVTSGAGLLNTGSLVFIAEYNASTGALRQSIALSNGSLIASGTATSEGQLNFSSDNSQLVLTGYAATAPVTGLAGTTSAAVNRVVGLIPVSTGTPDTSNAYS